MTPLFLVFALAAARAPEIALLHHPPASLSADENLVVSGQMVGGSEVEHAEIRFRMKGELAFAKAELELKQADEYEGLVNASRLHAGVVEYYVIAYDFLGKPHEVFASAKRPQRVTVIGKAAPPPTLPVAINQFVEPAAQPASQASTEPTTPLPLPGRLTFFAAQLAEMGVYTLADVLQLVPGLAVSRGIDGRYRVAALGRRDDAGVLLLLDGRRLNSAADGTVDLTYPTALLEQIDISFASPRASDLASSLMVIQMASRKDTLNARLLGGGGASQFAAKASGTYDLAVSGGGTAGSLKILGRAAAFYSDGSRLRISRDGLSDLGNSQTPGLTQDRAFRLVAGTTFEGELSPGHKLGFQGDIIYQDRSNYIGNYDYYAPTGHDRHLDFVSQLYAEGGNPAGVSYHTNVGYGRLSGDNLYALTPAVLEQRHYDENVISAGALVEAVVGQVQKLSTRVYFAEHLLDPYAFTRNVDSTGAVSADLAAQDFAKVPTAYLQRSELSLAFGDTIRPVRQLDLDLGLRFAMASDVPLMSRDLFSILTPVGGITFRPAAGFSLRALFDNASRAPTALQRYERPLYEDHGILGNSALRYTSQRTGALEATYQNQTGGLRPFAEARVFYNGVRGDIVALDQNGSGQMYVSDDGIETIGTSLYGRLGFGKRSYVSAGGAWQRAQFHLGSQKSYSLLTDTPQLSFVVTGNIEVGRFFDLFISATYYSERRNDARTALEALRPFRIPASTVVSLSLRSQPFHGLRALVILHNLLDERRTDDPPRPDRLPGLVPREGLVAMGGLEYAFLQGAP